MESKSEKTRIHIRLDERTRDRLQIHARLMSSCLGRRVSVGEWLGHLLDDMNPTRMFDIRDRLKKEQAGLEVLTLLELAEVREV